MVRGDPAYELNSKQEKKSFRRSAMRRRNVERCMPPTLRSVNTLFQIL
jgi:hypothetical protein